MLSVSIRNCCFAKLCLDVLHLSLYRATIKAVEAAIASRQWAKAVQILEIQDSAVAARYYKKIGDHYASIGEYEVSSFLLFF